MEYIQIPVPDFSFSDVAKDKAKKVCKDNLRDYDLLCFENTQFDDYNKLDIRLSTIFYELATKEDKIVYLSEVLIYLSEYELKRKNSRTYNEQQFKSEKKQIDLAKYYFYKQALSIGYNFDTNAFTTSEINDLTIKVDTILEKLNEIQLGQEILFDEIVGLKEDFVSLKSDFPLGKKRWSQRAAGIVASYIGTKGADEIYEILKPLLKDFFVNTAPHLIDKL